jgi:tetratricopeptide (TPR) repeat protein
MGGGTVQAERGLSAAERRGVALASLAALLAGCAHGPFREPGFTCAARGGPEWQEASTPHFVVSGDLTPGEITALARQLEEVRAGILEGFFHGEKREVPGRARVITFRDEAAFDEFAPPGLTAFLWPSGLGDHVVVMAAQATVDRRAVVAHELAHHLLRQAYPRQPRWFGEGFAALAEVLGGERDGAAETERERTSLRPAPGLVDRMRDDGPEGFFPDPARPRDGRNFGRLSVGFARAHSRDPVSARELLAWDGRVQDPRHRASSAVLVHFLLHGERARFADYRGRLAAAEPPERVWREVFREWDPAREDGPEDLDRRLAAHARLPGAREWAVDVPVRVKPAVRPLSPGEVHALRLGLPRLNRGRPGGPERERAEIEEALAEDPDHVTALFAKAAAEGLPALPLARRAAEAHPGDLRALLWLSQSLPRDGTADAERIAVLRRAVEVAPWNATAAGNLAWFLVKADEVEEAMPLAERAASLSPGNPNVLDTLAAVQEAAGRCAEALATAERAIDFLPEKADEVARAPWNERAHRLRTTCGRHGGAGGP